MSQSQKYLWPLISSCFAFFLDFHPNESQAHGSTNKMEDHLLPCLGKWLGIVGGGYSTPSRCRSYSPRVLGVMGRRKTCQEGKESRPRGPVCEVMPRTEREKGQVKLNSRTEWRRFMVTDFGPWILESLGITIRYYMVFQR